MPSNTSRCLMFLCSFACLNATSQSPGDLWAAEQTGDVLAAVEGFWRLFRGNGGLSAAFWPEKDFFLLGDLGTK